MKLFEEKQFIFILAYLKLKCFRIDINNPKKHVWILLQEFLK